MFARLEVIEIVIFFLGIGFFLVLAFGVWKAIQRGKNLAWLLPFFAVALAMMGFPAYQSIKIGDIEFSLQQSLAASEQNPASDSAKAAVQRDLNALGSVSSRDLEGRLLVARANVVLGDKKKGLAQVDSILKVDPTHREALQLKRRFELVVPHP